ncbi:MAG: AbrB family transcriptional regulator [Thermoprotei archaeon]|nr:MAG: AbrB family transcriptional regulator [Thermoprotei archaeon]
MVKVTRKRQITLPKEICDALGIKPGDYVKVRIDERSRIIVEKAAGLDELAGLLNPGYPVRGLAGDLDEERRRGQR